MKGITNDERLKLVRHILEEAHGKKIYGHDIRSNYPKINTDIFKIYQLVKE